VPLGPEESDHQHSIRDGRHDSRRIALDRGRILEGREIAKIRLNRDKAPANHTRRRILALRVFGRSATNRTASGPQRAAPSRADDRLRDFRAPSHQIPRDHCAAQQTPHDPPRLFSFVRHPRSPPASSTARNALSRADSTSAGPTRFPRPP